LKPRERGNEELDLQAGSNEFGAGFDASVGFGGGRALGDFDADGSGSTGYRRQRRQWSQEIPAAMKRHG